MMQLLHFFPHECKASPLPWSNPWSIISFIDLNPGFTGLFALAPTAPAISGGKLERGPPHLRIIALALVVICLLFVVTGCKRGPVPVDSGATENAEQSSVDAQLLEDILKAQKQSGTNLDQLLKDIRQQNAVQAEAAGPSPFQRDLLAAQSLLVTVRRAVNARDNNAAILSLRRLEQAVSMMRAECPVALIAASLERAAVALQGGAGYIEADVASVSVLNAQGIALKSPDAALVPNIGLPKELENVKSLIDQGEYKDALKSIDELVKALLGHDSLRTLANAFDGVRGARAAMSRDASYVVIAELDQLSDTFRKLSSMVKAAPAAQPAEATKSSTSSSSEDNNESAPAASSKPSDTGAKTTGETKTEAPVETPSQPAESRGNSVPEAGQSQEKTGGQ
jgi:hypothetical protein